MKDYKEIAESVLRRSEEVIAENRRKKRTALKFGSLSAALCLTVFIGIGVWQSGIVKPRDVTGELREKGIYAEKGDDAGSDGIGHDADTDNGTVAGSANLPGGALIGSSYGSDPDGCGQDGKALDNSLNDRERSSVLKTPSGTEDATTPPSINSSVGFPMLSETDSEDAGNQPKVRDVIQFYEEKAEGFVSEPCYAIPENGSVGMSNSLRAAMKRFGDEPLYCIVIELFADGELIDASSGTAKAEFDRLGGLGYTATYETYSNGEVSRNYLGAHASLEDLETFQASDRLGYFFYLHDERVTAD